MRHKAMRINSQSDYFVCLDVINKIEIAYDALPENSELNDDDMALHEELGKAIRGYLRGLDRDGTEKLKGAAPNGILSMRHQAEVDQLDREHMQSLARVSGLGARHKSDDELKNAALAGYLIKEQYAFNRKQRVKEQGRVVQCQECRQGFHSIDTERIKPFGATAYMRFCNKCAVKIKEAKAIYKGVSRLRRTGA